MKLTHKHPFHLVDPSCWPFFISFAAIFFTFGLVLWIHKYAHGSFLLFSGMSILIIISALWWRDVVREATYEGHHTYQVQQGLRLGIVLFITSEAILFFAFFWAFFHSSMSPSFVIGGVWPPIGALTMDPWGVPFCNTLILLCSGFSLTWSHHALISRGKKEALIGLIVTLLLAALFTLLQAFEYQTAEFSISDGVHASVFYMTTGLHGLHVIIGTIFLIVCALRMYANHFSHAQHLGFEAAIWYWHFVDVVWLFLFLSFYWWS